MKKFTIAAGIFLCSLSLFSQVWIDAGLKGGYGLDLIANKNFFDDHHFSPKLSTGYMFGGKVGFNFNSNHAVTLDITSSATNQKYTYSLVNPDSSLSNYDRSIGFNSINFLLMYRKSKNGTYFEIGPQYSMITKTRYSDNFANAVNTDITADLVKSYYSAVIGFGGYITGTDNFGIVLGCRFSYTFDDITSDAGKPVNFPAIKKYDSYKSLNPVTALMVLEFNFDVAYLASSGGNHKRKKVMLF